MRKSTFFLFLLSVLLLGTTEVIASSGLSHTNTPIELKSVSLTGSYQTAAVCFLPDNEYNDNAEHITDDDDNVVKQPALRMPRLIAQAKPLTQMVVVTSAKVLLKNLCYQI